MKEDIKPPFFSKSTEKFQTHTIEAWGMVRKHYLALKELSARDMPDKKYKKLWDYENYLIRMLKTLEEVPSLSFVLEEEKKVTLVNKPCNTVKYLGPCIAIVKTIGDPTGYGS